MPLKIIFRMLPKRTLIAQAGAETGILTSSASRILWKSCPCPDSSPPPEGNHQKSPGMDGLLTTLKPRVYSHKSVWEIPKPWILKLGTNVSRDLGPTPALQHGAQRLVALEQPLQGPQQRHQGRAAAEGKGHVVAGPSELSWEGGVLVSNLKRSNRVGS